LEYEWKKQTIRERAKEKWIREETLRNRILYYGMDVGIALTKKVCNYFWNPNPKKIQYKWKEYTVKELQKVIPLSKKTIYRKINNWEL
jgi:hypothetical protein